MWGGGLPRERVGAKKFDTSLETREIKLFGRDIPGFCRDIPEWPEKFEKKKFVFNFRSLDVAIDIDLDIDSNGAIPPRRLLNKMQYLWPWRAPSLQ